MFLLVLWFLKEIREYCLGGGFLWFIKYFKMFGNSWYFKYSYKNLDILLFFLCKLYMLF